MNNFDYPGLRLAASRREASVELSETIAYLEALYQRPIRPSREVGLRRTQYLLGRLGDPHQAFRSIHVTGSCGKGSTTTMAGSMLRSAGYTTGLFRSPHMDSYLERIAIDNEPIVVNAWIDVFNRVRSIADEMEAGVGDGYDLGRPALFEFMWACAALHFAERGVEVAAVEVGMGGRIDPTNILESDVSVVTNVSLEHTAILGDTEVAIAREKSAIIKPGSAAVTGTARRDVLEVLRKRAGEMAARLWAVDHDVNFEVARHDRRGEEMTVWTPAREHASLTVGLLGLHQARNAAVAVAAIDLLTERGISVPSDAVRAGLGATRLPGRFEIMMDEPLVILDGARNRASAKVLRSTVDDLYAGREMVLLIGVLDDKDAGGIAEILGPRAREAVVTSPPWEGRAADAHRLTAALDAFDCRNIYVEDPVEALERALSRQDDALLLVTGSLYLVALVRKLLQRDRPTATKNVLPYPSAPKH